MFATPAAQEAEAVNAASSLDDDCLLATSDRLATNNRLANRGEELYEALRLLRPKLQGKVTPHLLVN